MIMSRWQDFAERYRARSLASDRRAGTWARGKARRAQLQYIRRTWRIWFTTALVTALVLLVAVQFLDDPFVRGLLVGGVSVGVALWMWMWIIQVTGTAPTMMGDVAEQWTSSELRKLRKRGWRVVNHVLLKNHDIDHVLVGPGGVVAVETKWSGTSWVESSAAERLRRAVDQAQGNARDLAYWHELRSLGLGEVRSAVFLWGTDATLLKLGHDSGTAVVPGPHTQGWRDGLGEGRLSSVQIDQAWRALEKQCSTRDPLEATEFPMPRSFTEWAVRILAALVGLLVGFLAGAELVSADLGWVWTSLGMAGLILAGIATSRLRAARYIGIAWLVGVGMVLAIVVAVWVLSWFW